MADASADERAEASNFNDTLLTDDLPSFRYRRSCRSWLSVIRGPGFPLGSIHTPIQWCGGSIPHLVTMPDPAANSSVRRAADAYSESD